MSINSNADQLLLDLKERLNLLQDCPPETTDKVSTKLTIYSLIQILTELSLLIPFVTSNSTTKNQLEEIQTNSDRLFSLKQQEISKQTLLASLTKTTQIQNQCIEILTQLKNDLSTQTTKFTTEYLPKINSLKETKVSLKETLMLKDKICNTSLPLDSYNEQQINAKMVDFDLSLLPKSPA